MPTITGVKIPFEISDRGKLKEIADADYFDQLVIMAFSDCRSDNFFQELGFPVEILYDAVNGFNKTKIENFIEETFTAFESAGILQLVEYSVQQDPTVGSRLLAEIKFKNLISNNLKSVSIAFTG